MSGRVWKVGIVLAAAGVAAFWYGSPYLALRDFKAAVEAKDAEAFNARVDYPRVRASLKNQMVEAMAAKAGGAGAAIASMLGAAVTDRVVDALVRPEVIMRAMEEARKDVAAEDGAGRPNAPGPAATPPAPREDKVRWITHRNSLDKLTIFAGRDPTVATGRVAFVLERSGFADWKLTEIRLPRLQ